MRTQKADLVDRQVLGAEPIAAQLELAGLPLVGRGSALHRGGRHRLPVLRYHGLGFSLGADGARLDIL